MCEHPNTGHAQPQSAAGDSFSIFQAACRMGSEIPSREALNQACLNRGGGKKRRELLMRNSDSFPWIFMVGR